MVHGGMTLVKYLLFLFNFVFWLCGIAIIVVGTVIQIKYAQYINFLGNSFLSAPIVLIILGSLIAFLGFFGCCGAIRENYCMTMTFAVLLGIIFIVQLGAGIAGYVLRSDVEGLMMKQTKEGMLNYNQTGSEGVSLAWDRMQADFECCGTGHWSDWANTTRFAQSLSVPVSCCRPGEPQPSCAAGRAAQPLDEVAPHIFTHGCAQQFKDFFVRNVAIVGGIGCAVALVQVLGMCLACSFTHSLRNDYEAV